MILGLDIFWRDRLIDWSLAKTRFSFAFIKAGEYQIDPLFKEQWAAATGRVLRGAYWFFRPLVNAQDAANMFCDILGDDIGELEPAIDLEVFDGVTDLLERARVFVDTVYARTGKKCIIYTSRDVLASAGAGKKTIWLFWKYGWLREHRLWLAAPTNESNTFEYARKVFNGEAVFTWPSPPPPFDKIHFLQWTWYGVPELVPGYNLEPYHKLQVDWDFAADGELGELPPTDPLPPPTGDKMQAKTTTNLNVRETPAGTYVTTLATGTIVTVDEVVAVANGDEWAKISAPVVGYCANWFLEYLDTPPPPPAGETVTINVTRNSDGKSGTATVELQ